MGVRSKTVPILLGLALLTVFLSVGAVFFQKPVRKEKRWKEWRKITLSFLVKDQDSAKPIIGAELQMTDPSERKEKPVPSDDRGMIDVEAEFEASGAVVEGKKTGAVSFEGWLLNISADGYTTILVPLADLIGSGADIETPTPPRHVVSLQKVGASPTKPALRFEKYLRHDWVNSRISLLLYGSRYYSICDGSADHGAAYEAESGRFDHKDGLLKLTPDRQKRYPRRVSGKDDYDWALNQLIEVRWGKRIYLIAESQRLAFCDAINQGLEPRRDEWGDFFLRPEDEKKPAEGDPAVPTSWKPFILKAPIRAEVVALSASGLAKINRGANAGLRPGMELIPSEEFLFSPYAVESVEADTALLRAKYPRSRLPRIKVGDLVVSRRATAVRRDE